MTQKIDYEQMKALFKEAGVCDGRAKEEFYTPHGWTHSEFFNEAGSRGVEEWNKITCPFPDDIRDEILEMHRMLLEDRQYKFTKEFCEKSLRLADYVLGQEGSEWIGSLSRPKEH